MFFLNKFIFYWIYLLFDLNAYKYKLLQIKFVTEENFFKNNFHVFKIEIIKKKIKRNINASMLKMLICCSTHICFCSRHLYIYRHTQIVKFIITSHVHLHKYTMIRVASSDHEQSLSATLEWRSKLVIFNECSKFSEATHERILIEILTLTR